MDTVPATNGADLQDHDELAWLCAQARALRERDSAALDWNGLAEEVEETGKRLLRELESRLAVLIAHIIKLHVQPERYAARWRSTIREQQRQIKKLLRDAPSIAAHLPVLFASAQAEGEEIAADEMNINTFLGRMVWRRKVASFAVVMEFEPPLVPEDHGRQEFAARIHEASQKLF
jgi:hypothetical protein